MPGRNQWQNNPIATPSPGGSGVGTNWLPGYQERNKESLLEILGGVQEMAEEVSKVRPETWRAVTEMISTTGKVFGMGQAVGQIQNTLAMPARMMTSQLMFGLESQMIPLTNTLRQTTAQINQWIRKNQQSEGAQMMSMTLGLIGFYFGGPMGGMAMSLIGTGLGAISEATTGFDPFGQRAWHEKITSGDTWYSITRIIIADPGDEGINLQPPTRPTSEEVIVMRINRLDRMSMGALR